MARNHELAVVGWACFGMCKLKLDAFYKYFPLGQVCEVDSETPLPCPRHTKDEFLFA